MAAIVASFLGGCIYSYGGHVAPQLGLLQPGAVLISDDVWNDAVAIHSACGTNPWLILRWYDLNINQHTPEQAADYICAKAKALGALGIKCIAHGLNEQHRNRPRARDWELKFIERCHWHGVPTICSNYAFANFDNDEVQDFKDVWRESDYNGPHRYDLIRADSTFAPREDTSLRYRTWKGYPIEKDICTEFGVEDGGWRKLNVSADVMMERMLENVQFWKEDGALASTFFCISHTDQGKWGSYYGYDFMYKYWAENAPRFEPRQEVEMPAEFRFGFKAKADELGPAVVGVPEMDEAAVPVGNNNGVANRVLTLQKTSKGMMVYTDNGTAIFLPGK